MDLSTRALGRARDAAVQGPDLARRIAAALPRAVGLLDAADRLVARFETLLDRLDRCEAHVEAVVRQVSATEADARSVIMRVDETHRRARRLLDVYEPMLSRSVETLAYASERFGATQVDAVVALLDHEPVLREIEALLPTLRALETVAPDIKQLIAVSRGLNELMGSVPGMGKAKRRVDAEVEELQQQAEDTDSPGA